MTPAAPTFTFDRATNSVRLSGAWPARLPITDVLLTEGVVKRPDLVRRVGAYVTFRLLNGAATYRLEGRDAATGVSHARLVEGWPA